MTLDTTFKFEIGRKLEWFVKSASGFLRARNSSALLRASSMVPEESDKLPATVYLNSSSSLKQVKDQDCTI